MLNIIKHKTVPNKTLEIYTYDRPIRRLNDAMTHINVIQFHLHCYLVDGFQFETVLLELTRVFIKLHRNIWQFLVNEPIDEWLQ